MTDPMHEQLNIRVDAGVTAAIDRAADAAGVGRAAYVRAAVAAALERDGVVVDASDLAPAEGALQDAARRVGVSPETIHRWCLHNDAGALIDGEWVLDEEQIAKLAHARAILKGLWPL